MGHSVSVNGLLVKMMHPVIATWYAVGDEDLLKMQQLKHVSEH